MRAWCTTAKEQPNARFGLDRPTATCDFWIVLLVAVGPDFGLSAAVRIMIILLYFAYTDELASEACCLPGS
jgi:hypothetical protein